MSALELARALLARWQNGEDFSPQDLQDLSDQSMKEAKDLTPTEGRELFELFQKISVHAERSFQDTRKAINKAGPGRRALRGYGHLRPNRRSQHMRRKV